MIEVRTKCEQNLVSNEQSIEFKRQVFQDLLDAIGYDGLEIINSKEYFPDLERPDFVFNIAEKPPIPYYCSFYVEILPDSIDDKQRKVRAIRYNESINQARRNRTLMIGILTNLKELVLIISEPGEDKHYESINYGNFSNFSKFLLSRF